MGNKTTVDDAEPNASENVWRKGFMVEAGANGSFVLTEGSRSYWDGERRGMMAGPPRGFTKVEDLMEWLVVQMNSYRRGV